MNNVLSAASVAVALLLSPAALRASPTPRAWSLTLDGGLAFPLVGYRQYGPGVSVRAGADQRLRGPLDHRVGAMLGFTRFSINGGTLDLFTAQGTWRVYPFGAAFYLRAATGFTLSREGFDATLGQGRRLADEALRGAISLEAGLGVTLLRRVDIEAGYRHAVFLGGDGPDHLGQVALSLGVRL
jgi:hypothetical protein